MRILLAGSGGMLAICLLAGCSSLESFDDAFVAPGKFGIYNCEQLLQRGQSTAAREKQLRELMDRAQESSAGGFVNTLAYKSDYMVVQGELKQLEAEADAKRCEKTWRSVSDRSIR